MIFPVWDRIPLRSRLGLAESRGVKQAAGSMQTLTYKDYLAIRNLPNITYSDSFWQNKCIFPPLLRCFMHAKAAPQAFARGAALFN